MKDIYVNKEGVICACTVEVPKPPSILDCHITGFGKPDSKSASMLQKLAHSEALQACKNSAVPFEDQGAVQFMIRKLYADGNLLWAPKPDTFYQIEADWEIVEIMNHRSSPTAASVPLYKVARLKVPAPTVATDNSGALPKPSEMAIPDMEKLRSMMEDMPEQKRIEFINEHTEAAAKILYIAFHAAKLSPKSLWKVN